MIKVRDLDEALEVANGTDYALAAGFLAQSGQYRASQSRACRRQCLRESFPARARLSGGILSVVKMSGGVPKAGGGDYLLQFLLPRIVTENIMRHGLPEETPRYRDEFLVRRTGPTATRS